jgi:hypothetical protein
MHICKKCKSDLTKNESIQRTYHLPDNKKTNSLGHYTLEGDFEPDGSPHGSMEGAQTFNGDDTCFACNAIVG